MINKIVLNNFKSYYGEKEVGPLHKCFSAVLGPNGNGKSNLIESLLFVFGKKAKQMRLKKLCELIHNSATGQEQNGGKPISHAQVTVFFSEIIDYEDDPDKFDVIRGTEFTLSRKVDRSSKSTYYFNGKVTTFEDVCTIISKKGIDLIHNRFLILQGEVEAISLMKPKESKPGDHDGLLEFLEDIIGSNTNIEKIGELEK